MYNLDLNLFWKAVLIMFVGTLLLRIAGRRSISQMTVGQTVVMISIGSLLITPVSGRNIWTTFGVAAVIILTLQLSEYLQMKFDWIEGFFTGRALPVIENGQMNLKNMKKMRLTVDKLEMRLRQKGVTDIKNVQFATIEPNGQLGYLLQSQLQPATKQDIDRLVKMIESRWPDFQEDRMDQSGSKENIFTETRNPKAENPQPPHLQ